MKGRRREGGEEGIMCKDDEIKHDEEKKEKKE